MSLITLLAILTVTLSSCKSYTSPWGYTCEAIPEAPGSTCRRHRKTESINLSQTVCSLTCPPGNSLWPLPKSFSTGSTVTSIHPNNLHLSVQVGEGNQNVTNRLERAVARQVAMLLEKSGDHTSPVEDTAVLKIMLDIEEEEETFSLESDESYSLHIKKSSSENSIEVTVNAISFLGGRHAIETLFQLVDWDRDEEQYYVVDDVELNDRPFFPHRGLMLDTVRNFISVGKIKEVLDSLSYSKMNVLHWHLSDSQAFPIQMDFEPDFTRYGAYRDDMVYSKEDVKDIINYATDRGVVVIPELDAPAHVGAGWQAVDPDFTVCVNKDPWESWCVQAPCGQLNPAADGMYDVLESIYRELVDLFGPTYFHMGGDEVHFGCWNSSEHIVTWLKDNGLGTEEEDFIHLWNHFQTEALSRLDKVTTSPSSVFLWTSHLTLPWYLDSLNASRYTVQLWSNSAEGSESNDYKTIKAVAEGGFKMVFSNYDATYLDCGFGSWVGYGTNWCSPYKGWMVVYENNPLNILETHNVNNLEAAKANVMGGEVAMWTEQTDDNSLLTKVEPRAAAYAETLWRGSEIGDWREAEPRMVRHRERLRERGIGADALTERWCLQNPNKCLLEKGLPPSSAASISLTVFLVYCCLAFQFL